MILQYTTTYNDHSVSKRCNQLEQQCSIPKRGPHTILLVLGHELPYASTQPPHTILLHKHELWFQFRVIMQPSSSENLHERGYIRHEKMYLGHLTFTNLTHRSTCFKLEHFSQLTIYICG